MAHGYLEHFSKNRAKIYSAGVEKHGLNQKAVQIMQKDGIDISSHTSNLIEEYQNESFDYIITVCDSAKESCPIFPKKSTVFHQDFSDPSKLQGTESVIETEFEKTRTEIKTYMRSFINAYVFE